MRSVACLLAVSILWLGCLSTVAIAQVQVPPGPYSAAIVAGAQAFKDGDFATAEADFKAAVARAETDLQRAKAIYSVAVTLAKEGRLKEAREDANLALVAVPDYDKPKALLRDLDAAEGKAADATPADSAKPKKKAAKAKPAKTDATATDAAEPAKAADASPAAQPPATPEPDEPAPASTEPGGVKTFGKLSSTNGGCQFYIPEELFRNTELFARRMRREEFADVSAGADCESGSLISVDVELNFGFLPQGRLERSPFNIVFRGKMIEGRFEGKVNIWAQAWDVEDSAIEGPRFNGQNNINVYYRDGHVFFNEDDYLRPQREAEEAKQKAEALAADRATALDALKCDDVKSLDAKIGSDPQYDTCVAKQAEQKKADEEKARLADLGKQRDAARKALDCETVKTLDDQIKDSGEYDACSFESLAAKGTARDMFLSAVKFQTNGDRGRAKTLYLAIIDRFKEDDLAIKAGERLAGMSDVEAKEASDRSAADSAAQAAQAAAQETQAKIDQANQAAADRAYQDKADFCSGKPECWSSCSNFEDDDQRHYCQDQCDSKYSGC